MKQKGMKSEKKPQLLIMQIQNEVGTNIGVDYFLSVIHNVFFLTTKKKWFNITYHSYNGWSVKDAFKQVSSLANLS